MKVGLFALLFALISWGFYQTERPIFLFMIVGFSLYGLGWLLARWKPHL